MYHQFKELADVDITKEPMEVGPAQHYVMGGVEVDPDTGESSVPGLFAAGEVSGGMHGSNRLGGNSLSDLLVFGRRSGMGAAQYLDALGDKRPVPGDGEIAAAQAEAMAPFERTVGENPYTVHAEVQDTMSSLVGIIRKEAEIKAALAELEKLRERAAAVRAEGGPAYNPGWHLALDLRNIMLMAECVAEAALERQESRGGHTRDDFPGMSPEWRKVNLICSLDEDGRVVLEKQPMPPMREDLLALFDPAELKKYLTEEELPREAPAPRRRTRLPRARRRRRTDGREGEAEDLARRRRSGRAGRLRGRGQRGRGRAGHPAPAAGHPGRRPGGQVELQGRQVRLLLDGDQRHAAAGLHDQDVAVRAGRDHHGHADADLPGDQGPGHGCLVQLREGAADPVVHA